MIRENQRFVLRGIVSAARDGSCTGNKSTVFTDVAKFGNWIQYFIRNSLAWPNGWDFIGPPPRFLGGF